MKVLLTGATGFIGQHILTSLLKECYDVLCTRRATSDLSKCQENVDKCKWVYTDIDNWMTSVEEFKPEVIIHSAWEGVDAINRGNWTKQIENLLFQQQLLDIAAKVGTRKFIGIGSQAEYGNFEGCIDEDFPTNPNSAYGATKLSSKEIIKCFCELNKMEWYWFRLFSCFGEGESDNWLIPATVKNMIKGSSMDFTPGEQKYAYLYIGEVAAAIAAAVKTNAKSGVYNISSAYAISIKSLLQKIKDYVNPGFVLNFGAIPYREGQAMWMQGDSTKLNQNIYSLDSDHFEAYLKQTIEYYKKRNE